MQTLRRLFPCEYSDNIAEGKRVINDAVNGAITEKQSQQDTTQDKSNPMEHNPDIANGRRDILSQAISTSVIPDDLLTGHMTNILAACHKISSLAVTWTCFHLAKHPAVQSQLQGEIRSTLQSPSSNERITYEMLENMSYLKGVL